MPLGTATELIHWAKAYAQTLNTRLEVGGGVGGHGIQRERADFFGAVANGVTEVEHSKQGVGVYTAGLQK